MPVTELQRQGERTQRPEFSFEVPDTNEPPEYTVLMQESSHKPASERRRKSSAVDIAVAFFILGTALVSCFGVNREMVIRQFPQVAEVLHLKAAAPKLGLPTGADAQLKVWADLKTALYYCPGAASYGATRNGRYLSQAEARRANFEPAQRSLCAAPSSAVPTRGGPAHR